VVPVRLRGLVRSFGRTRALDAVHLEIEQGELFFLLGPSGCGKTTLLRSIAGFCPVDRGSILFGSRDVTRLPPRARDTGMVFQSYALWPHMSVEANVAFGLRVRRVPRAQRLRRVAEALESVHMRDFARRRPNQLSGGQQQRVALARALVVRPQCLLLDEPLSNLDAKLRLEMRGEIRRLVKEHGLTGVYVTHDQKEALTIADRMAVMFAGRVVQVGAPAELYRKPRSANVANFLGETNFLPGTVQAGQNGNQRVRTSVGCLEAAATDEQAASMRAAPDGRAVTVSIRPEALRVTPANATPPAAQRSSGMSTRANAFNGQILERIYLGDAVQVRVAIGDARLLATVPQRAGGPALSPGDAVALDVDPRDVVLLDE
jgi:iron(III) transport system ATP-binding protein